MIIGFIGTHRAITDYQKDYLEKLVFSYIGMVSEYHHGACVSADEFLDSVCRKYNIKTVIHPPNDDKGVFYYYEAEHILPKKPYLERNHDIVDCCDLFIAMPCEMKEVLRSGVWAAIRYARKTNKQMFIIYPEEVKDV
jgi:hypothetical protein